MRANQDFFGNGSNRSGTVANSMFELEERVLDLQ